MADRSQASLTIGGRIPIAVLPNLLAAMALDHALTDDSEEPVDESHFIIGEVLKLNISEAIGGGADHIEDFCERYGIPFVRHSGSCSGSFGAECAVFTGTGEPRYYIVSEHGQVLASQADLYELGSMKAINRWFAEARYVPPPISFDVAMVSTATAMEASHV